MTTRVKICGVTTPEDRDLVIAAGADAVGFISGVPVDTHREQPLETVADLAAGVSPFVTSVLVTAPADVAEAVERFRQAGTDAIQIHGSRSPADIESVGTQISGDVIVAVAADSTSLSEYADVADALLVDSAEMGGTGETHDWERVRALRERIDGPLILAGGLDPQNVAAAVRTVDPYGVDVASGVETEAGTKDHGAVTSFVTNAREAQV